MLINSISSGLMTRMVVLGGFRELERYRSFRHNLQADIALERRLFLARVSSLAVSVFAVAESCVLGAVCLLSILLNLLDEKRILCACLWLDSSLFTIVWGLDRAIFSRPNNHDLFMGEAEARTVLYRRYCETFPLKISYPVKE